MNRRTLLKGIGAALLVPCLPALPCKPSDGRVIKTGCYSVRGQWHEIEGQLFEMFPGPPREYVRCMTIGEPSMWDIHPDGTWERVA